MTIVFVLVEYSLNADESNSELPLGALYMLHSNSDDLSALLHVHLPAEAYISTKKGA